MTSTPRSSEMSAAPHTCPTCKGSKKDANGGPCPTCEATGVVWRDEDGQQEAAVTGESPTDLNGL
jgi:DnaJ-class molecular chaperone